MGVSPSRLIIPSPELPLELCQAITDEVDNQSDLLTLLRVSTKFNSAVERRLYNTISFKGPPPPSKAAQKKKLSVLERIIKCPRVAAYVFHLTLVLLYQWSLPSSYTPNYFAKLFLSVPNLKRLYIDGPSRQIIRGLPARAPFLLRTFECSHYVDPSLVPIVAAFLEAQVELEVLLSSSLHFDISPSALPKLTTFCGAAHFVLVLLPGRPITRVKYYKDWTQDSEASPFSASPIRSLCAGFTTDLKWCISLSPTLTFLSCLVWHYDNQEELMQYIRCCSRLSKLAVRVDERTSYFRTDEEKLSLVNSSFASCPSLCCIELNDSDEAFEPGKYAQSMTWMRGSRTGTPSLWDWDEWKKI